MGTLSDMIGRGARARRRPRSPGPGLLGLVRAVALAAGFLVLAAPMRRRPETPPEAATNMHQTDAHRRGGSTPGSTARHGGEQRLTPEELDVDAVLALPSTAELRSAAIRGDIPPGTARRRFRRLIRGCVAQLSTRRGQS